jgi:hypothetical protein
MEAEVWGWPAVRRTAAPRWGMRVVLAAPQGGGAGEYPV